MAAGAGRLAGLASGGVGDDLAVAERLVSNGEFEHAVEDQPAGCVSADG